MSTPYVGTIGGFRLLGPVQEDAAGQVYVADDPTGTRRSLLRTLTDVTSPPSGARFDEQAHRLESLRHPGLAGVLAHGVDDSRPWLLTPFIDGLFLSTGQIADDDAIWTARLIGEALDHAHAHGLVHGDLGPTQVLSPRNADPHAPGGVVIINVGLRSLLARPTGNPLTGTPAYAAPEVIEADDIGPAADRYSLACIFYQLLCGSTPFTGTPEEIAHAQLHQAPPPLSARRPDLVALESVFERALAKDPAQRFPDCRSLVDAVTERPAGDTPATAGPVSDPPQMGAPALDAARSQPTLIPGSPLADALSAGRHAAPSTATPVPGQQVQLSNTSVPTGWPAQYTTTDPSAPAAPLPAPAGLGDVPTHPAPMSPERSRRRRVLLAAGALATVAVLIGGLIVGLSSFGDDEPLAQTTTTTLATDGSNTCAIRDTSLFCWGDNDTGQIGDGTTENRTAPTKVTGLTGVTSVKVKNGTTCAVADGSLFCWGRNSDGQIGDGTTENRNKPTKVSDLSEVTAVDIGQRSILVGNDVESSINTCAVAGGDVYCWGHNGEGQLGDGTAEDRTKPVKVDGVSDVTGVTTDSSLTCALTGAGDVYCWGDGADDLVGDDDGRKPSQKPYLSEVTALATSVGTTCALSRGSLLCWGTNKDGQLGDGSRLQSRNPRRVTDLKNVTAVAVGNGTVCAIADNALYCWGYIGSNTLLTDPRSYLTRPKKIDALSAIPTAVTTRTLVTCVELEDQNIQCWGDNDSGALGIGSTQFTSTPTEVRF